MSLKSVILLQENGFELDLAPFECRRVEVSFAVATDQMAVSSYSPSAMLVLPTAGTKFSNIMHVWLIVIDSF